jgi:mono/diheme cytochrome c family protein
MRKLATLLLVGGTLLATAAASIAETKSGRALFHGEIPFSNKVAGQQSKLPTSYVACANCHAATGKGAVEAGSAAPPIRLSDLVNPRGPLPAYKTEANILAAVSSGEGRGATTLSTLMPRYNFTPAEKRDLLDYLAIAGTPADLPRGVTRHEIRIGTLLPLTGRKAAIGAAIRTGMQSVYEKANRSGGIYGRNIALVVEDTGAGEIAAAARLVGKDIFALNGSWLTDEGRVESTFANWMIDDVASLSLRKNDTLFMQSSYRVLYAMPALNVQFRDLVAAMGDCPAEGQKWISGDGLIDPGTEYRLFGSPTTMAAALKTEKPQACIGYLLGDAGYFEFYGDGEHKVVTPLPFAVFQQSGGNIWERLGRMSADVMLESLSLAGANLHERSPIDALYQRGEIRLDGGITTKVRRGKNNIWESETVSVSRYKM